MPNPDGPFAGPPLPLASTAVITATIPQVVQFTGLSRSAVYRLLAQGKLRAVKPGSRRTLILMESVVSYLGSLPAATFRAPKA